MNKKLIQLLYLSFDSDLSPQQQSQLDKALSQSVELRAEKEKLLNIRQNLSTRKYQFDRFFDARVMRRINSEAGSSSLANLIESLYLMFRRTLIASSLAGLVLLTLNFVDQGEISLMAAFGISPQDTENVIQTPLESVLE